MTGSIHHTSDSMKGMILAGGYGTRLHPTTVVTNKHLLPVYDKPMIFHPLETLRDAGIKDIMIICGKESAGDFMQLLHDGSDLGVELTYRVQKGAEGIAFAVGLGKNFVGNDNVVVILGDNIFTENLSEHLKDFQKGARIFLAHVGHEEAKRFGCPKIENNKILEIIEKPPVSPSPYAVTGLYVYDKRVFDIIKNLKPSARGELEITAVNNAYLKMNELDYKIISGKWSDAGTFESLFRATENVRAKRMG